MALVKVKCYSLLYPEASCSERPWELGGKDEQNSLASYSLISQTVIFSWLLRGSAEKNMQGNFPLYNRQLPQFHHHWSNSSVTY